MTSDHCSNCGHPTESETPEDTTTAGYLVNPLEQFSNGLGAITATSRLATVASQKNVALMIAIAIGLDYFSILSHLASLSPVC